VLFVEEGRVQTDFNIPVKSGWLSPEQALRLLFSQRNRMLLAAENRLAQWENENQLNYQLMGWLERRGLTPERLGRLSVAFGAVALLLLIFYRVGIRHRFGHDTTAPLLISAVSNNFPTRTLTDQRNRDLLKRRNLREPAAVLVRQWFARLGLEVQPDSASPTFEVSVGGWWQRRRVARRLAWLWCLASGRLLAARISAPELWRLQRELESLHTSWKRGEWRKEEG
jgi:hypothetical protein